MGKKDSAPASPKAGSPAASPTTGRAHAPTPSKAAMDAGLPGVLSIDMNITEEMVSKGFRRFDNNNNGVLSLAEIDKIIIEIYPEVSKHKAALQRAYRAADVDNSGFIEKREFAFLLYFIAFYESLSNLFNLRGNQEKRMDLAGLKKVAPEIGLGGKSEAELKQVFQEMDLDKGGYVLFDEFAVYCAKQRASKLPGFISERAANNTARNTLALLSKQKKSGAATAPPADMKAKKIKPPSPSKAAIAAGLPGVLSIDMKLTPDMITKGFKKFDNNNNNTLSLAEIDKIIIQLYPDMAKHKPAFIRAYKAADKDKSGYIEPNEFGELLFFLGFYDSMFQLFELGGDLDKRLDFDGFKKVAPSIGLGKKTDAELAEIYKEVDLDGGGLVLFDEFCVFLAKMRLKELPGFIGAAAVKNTTTGGVPRTVKYSLNSKKPSTTAAKKTTTTSPTKPAPVSRPAPTSTTRSAPSPTSPASTINRPGSTDTDRRNRLADSENKRLQGMVMILREQVESLGGKVDDTKIQKYSLSLDAYATQIKQLNEKIENERARYSDLNAQLNQAKDKIKSLEVANRKESLEEQKHLKSNQVSQLTKEITQLKLEKDKYVVKNDDLAKKLANEQEKNKKYADEASKRKIAGK